MSGATPVPQDLLAHAAFLRRLARSLLADAHAAEDVVQETWAKGIERPPARGGDPRAWLARVARNFALRRRRSEARRGWRERESARSEALPPAEASLERGEMLQRVVDAVRALEEPYRSTVLARFYEDLSPRAIAERERIAVDTVHTRLQRGLARLRLALERDRREWRGALGLLAGKSPCLPPHAGAAEVLTIMQIKTVVLVAAGLVAAWGLWRITEPPEPRSTPLAGAPEASNDADPIGLAYAVPPPGLRSALPVSQEEPVLSGRVVDEQGNPVPEARVLLMGGEQLDGNLHEQHAFPCDAEGRWQAVLPGWTRVYAELAYSVAFEGVAGKGEGRWIDVPASDVDFVVRRIPTGTIEVRVVEGARRVPVTGFWVAIHGGAEPRPDGGVAYSGGYRTQREQGSVLVSDWRVDDPAGVAVHVVLMEPEVGNLWSKVLGRPEWLEQVVHLLPGETEHVLFVLPERGVLRGQVVDPDGAPVVGALVYFGPGTRARGDEPFRPFRPERITDGALTGADGWFELRGDGQEVTAGHADFTAMTVPARQASRIVLGARGALRGRLLDPDGRAMAGVVLRLDERSRGPETTTAADGGFTFEHLEGGAHGVFRERELVAAVRLAPGEEAELELVAPGAGRLELALRSDVPLDLAGTRGLLVGFERVSGLYEVEPGTEPATLVVPTAVLPGQYWLATSTGLVAPLTIEPGVERVEIPLGTAELRVSASQRVNVQAVPADADAFVRLVAARGYVKVDAENEALFRLPPGRYLLVGEAGCVLRELDVPPEGAAVALE